MEGSLTNYIDAERLRKKLIERLDLFKELSSDTISPIRIDECKQIIDIIDSLQQEQPEEMDIEKEIEEHVIYMPHGEFSSDNEIIEDMEWARKEFFHFYELGLKARK